MLIQEIIDRINSTDIIFDNESLSLPFFRKEKEKISLVLFTYSMSFDFNLPASEIFLGRGLEIKENGEVNFFDIKDISLGYKQIFPYSLLPGKKEYGEVVQSMQHMIDSGYTAESVQRYAMDFNSFVPENLMLPYWELGKDYFEWICGILGEQNF